MSPRKVTCPTCGQSDLVEKASTLYLLGAERKSSSEQSSVPQPAVLDHLSPAELRGLGRRLAPPSSPKQGLTRPVHPDLVVFVFSLVLPIFLYGIYTSQPGALLGIVPLLLAMYGLYFWQRRRIVERFDAQQQARRAEDQRVRRAIQRWMGLYYCLEDDGVFLPGDKEITPADQMMGRLMR